MRYPVKLEKDGDGYFVSFPDIPEALTQGDTREEALEMARDALVTAFEFYFEDNQPVPLPGESGDDFVTVPASIWAKVLLLNAMLETGTSNAELARRMNLKPQEVQRIVTLGHNTKIDTTEAALAALGKRLEILVN
ncbi:type II toxin-antitoxin system HicB family antitoxin [Rahnella sp. C60]|uniref:type II toxin-antitoxin system HicB family antitoxin n=1 Tax=Rahnella TaxID=34037 RepID=UPI001C25FCC7|nr:type II toxin-antitoxin system HicB family antitoxin [Rahnella perminowiae]MBU9818165.1 type II toxin-antitoxin system HicB family antitoxin [Rahnella perminowiae]